jgi:hypothetical protein
MPSWAPPIYASRLVKKKKNEKWKVFPNSIPRAHQTAPALRDGGRPPAAKPSASVTSPAHSSPSARLECTRGRKALGKERLSRVPWGAWHSGKLGTRGSLSSLSATLGEEWHSGKKFATWRLSPPVPLQLKNLLRVPRPNTRGRASSPSAAS